VIRVARLIAIAVVALATVPPARAQEAANDTVAYRVKQGDSLELIAAEFYGDRTKSAFIAAANKLARPRPLKPGERLRVPVVREVATSPGDTFESLAATYLGSARRGTFLADFNSIPVEDNLPAGTVLVVPLTVVHTAASTESMGEISRQYFGDARSAELLRRYNFLDKPTIDKAETVIVPALHTRLAATRQPPMEAEAKTRRDRRRDASARVARALPAAHEAWKTGDFAQVKAALAPLEPELDYLDLGDAVDVGVLVGVAYLAYDEGEPALAAFKRVLDRQPHHTLARYAYSPKIIALWQKAGGQVE